MAVDGLFGLQVLQRKLVPVLELKAHVSGNLIGFRQVFPARVRGVFVDADIEILRRFDNALRERLDKGFDVQPDRKCT